MSKRALLIIDVQMAMFAGETHVYRDDEVFKADKKIRRHNSVRDGCFGELKTTEEVLANEF